VHLFSPIENRLSLRLISPLAEIENLNPVVSHIEPLLDYIFQPDFFLSFVPLPGLRGVCCERSQRVHPVYLAER
jgi:hypothetical protein